MARGVMQLESTDRVAWDEAKVYTTIDGEEVTHFGLDRSLTRYYRTQEHTYVKHGTDWTRI